MRAIFSPASGLFLAKVETESGEKEYIYLPFISVTAVREFICYPRDKDWSHTFSAICVELLKVSF
jgi:hypothetical protein